MCQFRQMPNFPFGEIMFEKLKKLKIVKLGLWCGAVAKKYELSQISAGIAYYFTLSVFPFLMFLAALLGLLNLPADVFASMLVTVLSETVANTVMGYYAYLTSVSNVFSLVIGLGLSLYSASRAIGALVQGIQKIYVGTDTKSFWRRLICSVLFTAGIGFALLILLILASVLGTIPTLLGTGFWLYLLCVAVIFFVFTTFYCLAPSPKLPFARAWPGGLLCVGLLHIISIGVGIYVRLSVRFSVLYGSIGAIVVVMLWLYLFGYSVLIGALLNRFLQIKKGA